MALPEIIERHRAREGPLLPLLHDVQAEFGYVGEEAIRAIASALNLTRAEVHGVVSFYHDFTAQPKTARLKLCKAEACQARGVERLRADDARIEPIYCLGLCSIGPAAMVDGKIYARLDQARLDQLVAGL